MKPDKKQLQELINQLDTIHEEALELEKKFAGSVHKAHPSFRKSAKNLLHYLALRHRDIRDLQDNLAQLGLSSLGRAEGHVLASLEAVRNQLCYLIECEPPQKHLAVSYFENRKLLSTHTDDLLGLSPHSRSTRIMVTFSTDLATDYDLVVRMMKAGMDCARINCAHDNERVWASMIRNIKQAEKETGLSCKILIDLMGPKLRTGPLKPGPQVIAIHPVQNELGQVAAPAKVWLAPPTEPAPKQADASLPLDAAWVSQLQVGDLIRFQDTRGRRRTLSVVHKSDNGVLANLLKTSYIATGTRFVVKDHTVADRIAEVGHLPSLEVPILLKKDHMLILHRDAIPGEPSRFDADGHITNPAHISCTLPEVFKQVKKDQPILFDDGSIEGRIMEVNDDSLLIKITYAKDAGSKLRADKGINLPESKLRLSGLTEKDKKDLKFVVKHADIVNLSFVNYPETVDALHEELRKLKAEHLPVMLKIETKEGFRNLPHLLLAVMKSYPAGIMIARGDLAVECGWQRLAEVQEEILWLCEAAHIPVVWATQVLETLAKKGRPSRAEITDAAMSQRADCVMLNKGPHIIEAIQMLDDILSRMQMHQRKKTSMLRSLHISELEPQTETAEQRSKV
ncbi:pyruvate kinase [Pontibacter ruber]|uniref:pyruvate kinase n=1 Tax=Pontibacter ruber TaxID=1343895 RepID=A0ABW5D1Y8_9BACT|nr:pyruvate kinase [Pontibacter ruber]